MLHPISRNLLIISLLSLYTCIVSGQAAQIEFLCVEDGLLQGMIFNIAKVRDGLELIFMQT